MSNVTDYAIEILADIRNVLSNVSVEVIVFASCPSAAVPLFPETVPAI